MKMKKSDKILLLLIVGVIVAVLAYSIPRYAAGNVYEADFSPYYHDYDDDFLLYYSYFY